MKKNILLFFFLTTLTCFSQQKNISIESFRTNDRIFYGSIDGKYDITIYLKVEKFSEDHLYVYSVKGWYYYDKVKKNIPLVGVFNPMTGLTLFNTNDKSFEKKILDFDFSGVVWDKLDKIETFKNYNEKLFISNNPKENIWSNNTKNLQLTINNELKDIYVFEDFKFLKIGNSKINLSNYHLDYKDLEIVSKKISASEIRLLLKYEQYGNPNIQGMCGGAMDYGYVILVINNKNELIQFEEIETDNCRAFIHSEDLQESNKKILKYKITDSNDDKESSKIITIDTESIRLIK
ncbi:hypothetical protein [Flavobacterium sp. HJJ]|uniref:hypothetical protein n=1 Tax=Flavobacterium sp. HJJ TaxID=2783792 RepID=UPI00188C5F44|nr:hypothetical protein [Flavobacterium sp. HJJ]MBF4471660.1 hypothetical protein [Flavobacterium sp. HJJ]